MYDLVHNKIYFLDVLTVTSSTSKEYILKMERLQKIIFRLDPNLNQGDEKIFDLSIFVFD